MLRLIHTSDWHLHKDFTNRYGAEIGGALQEARRQIPKRIADRARQTGASLVLVAGDIFDSHTPDKAKITQLLTLLREAPDLRWVLIPGNHDPAWSGSFWHRLSDLPENVFVLRAPEPLILKDCAILPAPVTEKKTLRDVSQWMDLAATPAHLPRIGLAHGRPLAGGENPIAPDRVTRARLDYLAMGDEHQQRMLNDRCWFSGTPEPESFPISSEADGRALLVSVAAAGVMPQVEPISTGAYRWRKLVLARPEDAAVLGSARSDLMLQVSLPDGLAPEAVETLRRLRGRLCQECLWCDWPEDDLDRAAAAEALAERIGSHPLLARVEQALSADGADPVLAREAQRLFHDLLQRL